MGSFCCGFGVAMCVNKIIRKRNKERGEESEIWGDHIVPAGGQFNGDKDKSETDD